MGPFGPEPEDDHYGHDAEDCSQQPEDHAQEWRPAGWIGATYPER